MFDNIGSKIKTVTVISCIIGIIACIILGMSLIAMDSYSTPTAGIGWTVMIVGSLTAWIGSFVMYGFGELVEKTCENNEALLRIEKQLKENCNRNNSDKGVSSTNSKPNIKEYSNPKSCEIKPALTNTPVSQKNDKKALAESKVNLGNACDSTADSNTESKHFDMPLSAFDGICPGCGLKYYNTDRIRCVRCGATFGIEEEN